MSKDSVRGTHHVLSNPWKVLGVALVGWIIPAFLVLAGIFVYPEIATSLNPLAIPALAVGAVVVGCGVRLFKERSEING